jgi:hypothetical protein
MEPERQALQSSCNYTGPATFVNGWFGSFTQSFLNPGPRQEGGKATDRTRMKHGFHGGGLVLNSAVS